MEPIELAVLWVRAGGRQGSERDALVKALHSATLAAGVGEWVVPSGKGVATLEGALRCWKSAARRRIAAAPRGARPKTRVPVTVWATAEAAERLRRGERVSITGATLVEVDHG